MRCSCISYTDHDHLQSILTMSVCWPHPSLCWSPLYTDHFTKLTIICMYLKFVSCHIWLQGNMHIYLSVDFIVKCYIEYSHVHHTVMQKNVTNNLAQPYGLTDSLY